jgi:chromosomal replication initiation ATPase DnaA
MKAMMEEAPLEATVEKQEAPVPADEVLKMKWPELAECYNDKPRLASMLKSTSLDIEAGEDAKTVIFRVVNDAQKDWVESKLLHELEGNYRRIVGSMKIYLRVAVTPDNSPEQKKIYMPSEQAKELMAQNEEVKNLVKALELDIK